LSRTMTQASDVEDLSNQLIYELTELPAHGQLVLNGQVLTNASTFSQADIDQGLVLYQHNNQDTVADRISFTIADSSGARTAPQTIQLTIQASPVVIVTPPSGTGTGGGTTGNTTPSSGGGGTVKDIGGSTTPPAGSAGSTAVVNDLSTLPSTFAAANGTAVNSSNGFSRGVAKNTANLGDSALASAAPPAGFDVASKSLNVNRDLGQSAQEGTLSSSILSASLASTAAGLKFDGLGFTRVKNQSELAEYVEITRATLRDKFFSDEVQKVRDEMNQTLQLDRNVVASATAVSASLSIGYVIWLVRGGALLSSLLASLPAWRMVDPLPVLGNMASGEDQNDDDSLDEMIHKSKAKRLAAAQLQTS
jgi:Cadherin-like